MSDEAENGNGNRATVAMVLREVENLTKLSNAQAKTTDANFKTVHVKLEAVEKLSDRQDKMDGELRALSLMVVTLRDAFAHHVKETESRIEAQAEDKRFHRVHWPTVLGVIVTALIAIAAIVFN